MQVVLDTNVLVSGLAFPNGPPGRIVSAWRAGAFSLVASEFMLDELARILPALSHRTRFSAADVRDFLDLMRAMSTIVELSADHLAQAQGSGLRDPDDAPFWPRSWPLVPTVSCRATRISWCWPGPGPSCPRRTSAPATTLDNPLNFR